MDAGREENDRPFPDEGHGRLTDAWRVCGLRGRGFESDSGGNEGQVMRLIAVSDEAQRLQQIASQQGERCRTRAGGSSRETEAEAEGSGQSGTRRGRDAALGAQGRCPGLARRQQDEAETHFFSRRLPWLADLSSCSIASSAGSRPTERLLLRPPY